MARGLISLSLLLSLSLRPHFKQMPDLEPAVFPMRFTLQLAADDSFNRRAECHCAMGALNQTRLPSPWEFALLTESAAVVWRDCCIYLSDITRAIPHSFV